MQLVSAVKSLRRYARALTLSQRIADRMLVRTLQSIAARRHDAIDIRLDLFRTFHQVWKGEQATFLDAEAAVLVDRRLSRLPRADRATLLLTCMEEFPVHVVAGAILMRPLGEVRAAHERAVQLATWWPEIETALHQGRLAAA